MSYEIVKSLVWKKDGSFTLSSASSNVYPKTPNTTLIPAKDSNGKDNLLSLLDEIQGGSFQLSPSANGYSWQYALRKLKPYLGNDLVNDNNLISQSVCSALKYYLGQAKTLKSLESIVAINALGDQYLSSKVTSKSRAIKSGIKDWAITYNALQSTSIRAFIRNGYSNYRDTAHIEIKDNGAFKALSRDEQFFILIDAGDVARVGAMLDNGHDINSQDELGKTGLMNAAINKDKMMLQLFEEKEADFSIKDSDGRMFLSEIVAMDYPMKAIINIAKTQGLNVFEENVFGEPLLFDIIKNSRYTLEDVTDFIDTFNIDIDSESGSGNTALNFYCGLMTSYASNSDVLTYLVQNTSPEALLNKGLNGESAIFDLADKSALFPNDPDKDVSMTLKAFIRAGTDINHVFKDGDTLFHKAVRRHRKSLEIVKYMIDSGADISIKDASGLNALERAKKDVAYANVIEYIEVQGELESSSGRATNIHGAFGLGR